MTLELVIIVVCSVVFVDSARSLWTSVRRRPARPDDRIAVLESLLAGQKLAQELPLPPKSRGAQLLRDMAREGMIDHDYGHTRQDGKRIYRIERVGIKLLGEQER